MASSVDDEPSAGLSLDQVSAAAAFATPETDATSSPELIGTLRGARARLGGSPGCRIGHTLPDGDVVPGTELEAGVGEAGDLREARALVQSYARAVRQGDHRDGADGTPDVRGARRARRTGHRRYRDRGPPDRPTR